MLIEQLKSKMNYYFLAWKPLLGIICISLMSGGVQAATDCWGNSVDESVLSPGEVIQKNFGNGLAAHCIVNDQGVAEFAVCINVRFGSCDGQVFDSTRANSATVGNNDFDYDIPGNVTSQGKTNYISDLSRARYRYAMTEKPPVTADDMDHLNYLIYCYQGDADDCNRSNANGVLSAQQFYIDAENLIKGTNVSLTRVTPDPQLAGATHVFRLDTESGILNLSLDGGGTPFLCDASGNAVADANVTITASSFRDDNFTAPSEIYHLCVTEAGSVSRNLTLTQELWAAPASSGTLFYPRDDDSCQGFAQITGATERADSVVSAQWGAASAGGSITIIKDATPDDPQDFAFTATGTGTSNFLLDDDADVTLSNTQAFTGLTNGNFSFTEAAVVNWTMTGVSCTGNTNSTITKTATGIDITLSDNEDISCTFYNNTHTCLAGEILNQSTITANESETTYANNSAAACLTVTAGTSNVDLSLEKTASSTSAVSGDTITYTIIVTNGGPDDATGVEITDQLPAGVTYANNFTATQGAYVAGTGIWTVGALANAATATLTIDVTVD